MRRRRFARTQNVNGPLGKYRKTAAPIPRIAVSLAVLKVGFPVMKIAVIGTGYVGLVTATCLAESGNDVVGMDSDARKIEVLHAGQVPIYEPGLKELGERNLREGRLAFTTDLPQAVRAAQLVFIAVGTPQAADGSADL